MAICSDVFNVSFFFFLLFFEIEVLEKETSTVCEMYKLIESYSVPTPPEDIAVYATLPPCVTAIKNTIDKAVGERDSNVDKFCQHLQQDINQLNNNVLAVKEQAEVKERRENEKERNSNSISE